MKRLLRNLLSLNTLRKSLGYGNIFSAVKFELHLKVVNKINFKNVLILSPHPDDDSLGMGGFIKKMTSNGAQVHVAYFCDGSGGLPEGRGEGEEVGGNPVVRRDNNLVATRRQEATAAAQILGISETVFFGYQDGKLASGTSATKAMADLIERVKPDIIFLPSFLDNHGDHRVTNEIFINSSQTLSGDFPVWAYEIWTPIFANRLVDISLYIKTKGEAIAAHQSQIKTRRYDKAIIGLNQYRAEINGLGGYAEAFFAVPLKIYKELYRKS